jgi:hypothetical protein
LEETLLYGPFQAKLKNSWPVASCRPSALTKSILKKPTMSQVLIRASISGSISPLSQAPSRSRNVQSQPMMKTVQFNESVEQDILVEFNPTKFACKYPITKETTKDTSTISLQSMSESSFSSSSSFSDDHVFSSYSVSQRSPSLD